MGEHKNPAGPPRLSHFFLNTNTQTIASQTANFCGACLGSRHHRHHQHLIVVLKHLMLITDRHGQPVEEEKKLPK